MLYSNSLLQLSNNSSVRLELRIQMMNYHLMMDPTIRLSENQHLI